MAIGRNQFEEERKVVVFDVGVDELLAVPVHDADIHLAGMEIDSAVELCGGGVILHGDRSLWGPQDPGVILFGYAGAKCWCTCPPSRPDANKINRGLLRGSIIRCRSRPPIDAVSPHSRLTDLAARLSFCR